MFALLERADGQRCRAMRDGQLACCATLVDGREACWPRAADTIEWRPQPTMDDEQTAGNTPITALLSTVSCATTVERRQGCCARGHDGALRCWTDAHTPAVDDPTNGPTARVVEGLRGVRRITAGGRRTCALLRDASVWCWGSSFFHVIGTGNLSHADRPVRVAALGPAAEIAVTHEHACARGEDGWLACWGSNSSAGPRTPVASGRVTDVAHLALGSFVSCALRRDGRAACWGGLDLGNGVQRWTEPTELSGIEGASRIVIGTAGGVAPTRARVCAITANGTVRCLGGARTVGED